MNGYDGYSCTITDTKCIIHKNGVEIPLNVFFKDTSKGAIALQHRIITEAKRWKNVENNFALWTTFKEILTNINKAVD